MSKPRTTHNNRSNQLNPNNPAYHSSRQGRGTNRPAIDNRANQLNPNHAPTKPAAGAGGTPKKD